MRLCSVGDVVSHKKGFAFKSKDYSESGTPLVKVSDFDLDTVSTSSTMLPESFLEEYADWRIEKDDILIATVGSWGSNPNSVVGKVVRVVESAAGALLNQNTVRLRTDEKCNQRFLFYCLKQNAFKEHCLNSAQGSANQASITLSDIKNFRIPDHSYVTQQAIAHILGTLDDKIELNQKMNQTLEEIAKTIFKSWFVDFDPVRAKAEGRPTGLPPEISDLFPDELVDSEIGEIPKGWDVTNVGEITSKETLKVKKFSAEVKVLSAVNSGQLRLSEEYFTKQVFSKNIDNYYVVPRLSFAYNPSRINIGSIGLNLFDFSGAVSPVYSVFTVREGMHWFFREWLNLGSTKGLIASLCSGSVRQSLKHPDMESILLVPPPTSVNTKFNEIYELFMKSIRVRNQENQVLSELRDTLLPKLISGELRIPDAEKFLEGAGL